LIEQAMSTIRGKSEASYRGIKETSLLADQRRQSLVSAAFEVIATDGFEGLRTRFVAARAGVNVATLHYYFPTKETLIGGVAEHLATQFVSLHGAKPVPSGSAALDRLHQEFSDVRFYHAQHPELLVATLELQLRSRRDEAIARIIDPLMGHWHEGLEKMVRAGMNEGVFRADLEPAAAAFFLMAAFSGVMVHSISINELDGTFAEMEHWLLKPLGKPFTVDKPARKPRCKI
jgi:TetR/AcrR family transcriptional regulator, regulator of cefoperazone and chloramphenicol sensitivity